MELQSGLEGGIGWGYSPGQMDGLDGVLDREGGRDWMELQSGREGGIGWSYSPVEREGLDGVIVREGGKN